MKSGPVIAMIAFLVAGVALVLTPSLNRSAGVPAGAHRFEVVLGAQRLRVDQRPVDGGFGLFEYRFVDAPEVTDADSPLDLVNKVRAVSAEGEPVWLSQDTFAEVISQRLTAWDARPAWDRGTLGFFNISSWLNMVWVAVGLGGQIAFFGRMLVQWIVSENKKQSVVPEAFWWLSLFGGIALFTYFVWRVDFVGVLGQCTGIVIYARNLRLIRKQKRRDQRAAAAAPANA